MKNLLNYFLIIFVSLILIFSLRGIPGNPTQNQLNLSAWKDEGPFELSPERGRFALTYSIAESHSFEFSNEVGLFALPDVGVHQGRFVSLFPPALSFITLPGYIIGKYFNVSQLGTFAVISLFAILNTLLIRSIALKLGANSMASTLGALGFLFATPAFSYAVTLYQHHVSTFLILMSIYLLMKFNNFWSITLVFLLCGISIPLDNPNLFLMFPIGVWALCKIFMLKKKEGIIKISTTWTRVLAPVILILPIAFLLWFNLKSNGDPLKLSGTLHSASSANFEILKDSSNTELQKSIQLKNPNVEKNAVSFFQTRNLLNGFYIHFFSPDRGIIFYTPVMLLGILGFILAYKKEVKFLPIFLSIVGFNILIYSLWDDPWGGWAFGSRYLIPSFAILSIFVALSLTYLRKNLLYLIIFLVLFTYSVGVNTLGAITSSANPPEGEAKALEKITGTKQEYTYLREWNILQDSGSKSFVFQTFAKNYMSARQYFEMLLLLILAGTLTPLVLLCISGDRKKE